MVMLNNHNNHNKKLTSYKTHLQEFFKYLRRLQKTIGHYRPFLGHLVTDDERKTEIEILKLFLIDSKKSL